MKMRMWYIALLSLLALTACQKEPVLSEEGNGNSSDPSKLSYNLTIDHPDGSSTKGVKREWGNGDKVFLFIQGQGITTGYLTATMTETEWETTYVGTEPASLEPTGILHAVYLPYVDNEDEPRYEAGQWTFSSGTDTYYFYASDIPYKVSSGVLSATVQMKNRGEYVQFFIPYTGASGTIQLACNGFRPAGFAGIDPDTGTITEKLGDAGSAVQGYPDTLEGEEGYYLSGKQTAVKDNDYYFALQKADGSYAHYFKHRAQAMVDNKAYKLPSFSSWRAVGINRYVKIAGEKWKTVNEGATHPWEMGTTTPSFEPAEGKGLPTASNWSALLNPNVASWKEMDIMGQKGYLVVSEDAPTNYVFLPWSTDSDTDYWIDEFGAVVRIATDGTKTDGVTPAPATAYARMLEKMDYFRIKATKNNTTMTFRYTDGSIEYSEDQGGSWYTYDGKTFNLNAGDEVWFRGNRSDCNCNENNTALFTANNVCYIAGDITSLLANKTTLPANAFRSAFSYGRINDSELNKDRSLTFTVGNVDWIDIDPNDPLILPASTATNCYLEMFMGCTSLHSAPDLPATELAEKCYFQMFYGCSGLTSIPTLPSKVTMSGTSNRRRYCYQMFQNCTGIKKLEGSLFGETMTLQTGCFEDMFANCTGLEEVSPDFLPATTLAAHCYRGMFQNTRFKKAPNLPAKTLVTYCYRYMFYNCSKLNYIKCLATNPPSGSDSFTRDWVGGSVPNSGTFIKNNDEEMTSSWATGVVYGIHSGWTAYQLKDEPE